MSARQEIVVPVAEVLLLEDRAQVRRRGSLRLPAGRCLLAVPEVAPALVDRTLQAAARGAQVVDLRVVRSARLRRTERPADLAAREAQERALREQVGERKGRLARRSRDLELARQVEAQVLAELAQDVAWGVADPEAWTAALAPARARADALAEQVLDLQDELALLERRLTDLALLVASLEEPASRLRADLHLELVVEAEGEVALELGYVVPGACWRPLHRATLHRATVTAGLLTMETFGVAWQRTGEDWTGAALSLSTQRASLGVDPPLLDEDELRARPRQEAVVIEAREQAIQTAGLGGEPGAPSPVDSQLPGIDDGGEVRTLRVQGRPSLPSDGRPHHLPLSAFTSPATLDRVALPERAPVVLRRVRAQHQGEQPLLAGPVELVVDGGRVGRTSLRFIAPGERFELGLGPDPDLRLHRRAERVDPEPGPLSRWTSTEHRITLRLSNLGTEARSVELTERIPVSEVEQVRVELDARQSSPGCRADADGMVRLPVDLAPGGTAERVLAWKLERKRDVAGV